MRQLWMWLFISCAGIGWLHTVDAQEISLELNETVAGKLEEGEQVTYKFEIPVTQDVLVTYEADYVILSGYSVTIVTSDDETTDMLPMAGGGGSDDPVTRHFIIPAYRLPHVSTEIPEDMRREVTLTLGRPLEGTATYTMSVFPIEPRRMSVAGPMSIVPWESEAIQVMVIEQRLQDPFTVEIEALDDDGVFLWVANVPSIWQAFETITASQEPLIAPEFVDAARLDNNISSIQEMTLFYAGDENFRLVIHAAEPYTVHYLQHTYTPLLEAQPQLVSATYQLPMQFLQFDAHVADSIIFTARLIEGTGAVVRLYEEGNVDLPETLILGDAALNTDTVFPDRATLTVPITQDGQMTVVVQIPNEFDRSAIQVEIEWEPNPNE